VLPGILRLALIDLRASWLRAISAIVLIGFGAIGVAYFVSQAQRTQTQIQNAYEEEGASNFIVELSGLSDEEVDRAAAAIRPLANIRAVDVPYNGVELGLQADVSFLVFQNAQQKEYLGAHASVLGVEPSFRLRSGYYVDFRWLNSNAPRTLIGIPLLPTTGEFRAPQADEILLPLTVTDYVGVQPGARATVELAYAKSNPPIVCQLDDLKLVGTFDAVGPDRERIDPFWRLSYVAQPLLTARGSGGTEVTTLPVILNAAVVQDFLHAVQSQIGPQKRSSTAALTRGQLVVKATSVANVSAAQNAVVSVLQKQGLKAGSAEDSDAQTLRVLVPERNNFVSAQREQHKIGAGASYFAALLLCLLAFTASGLQTQATLARWRDYGVLQAFGFSPGQILILYGGQLLLVVAGAILLAGLTVLLSPYLAGSRDTFTTAALVTILATLAGVVPALAWPMRVRPAEMLKELQ
jgi:hypothetical protein